MATARGRMARNQLQARLLALEKLRGMRPSHVARKARMSLVYYQEIWSKNRIPSQEIILNIARALDEDPRNLLFLAERERAPAEAKQFFRIHEPPRFPRLRRALMDAMENAEELATELTREPLGLVEKWIYYALLSHFIATHKGRPAGAKHFSRSARKFTPILKEGAAESRGSVFASVSAHLDTFLEARETQDEYIAFLRDGLSHLSYRNFVLELREKGPERGGSGRAATYLFMGDPQPAASWSPQPAMLRNLVQADLHRSYDPESLRRAILYSPDFETLEPGLKDLVYDEAFFRSLQVTPNEFFFLRDSKVRGYGGEPLKDAYKFLLEQYRKERAAAVTSLSHDEQRLIDLYRELSKEGKEEVLIYLEFTHGKAKFRRSVKHGATTEQAG